MSCCMMSPHGFFCRPRLYYNKLSERGEKTEAIDILHFKIARGMKKLLIFNCFCLLEMSRNTDNV